MIRRFGTLVAITILVMANIIAAPSVAVGHVHHSDEEVAPVVAALPAAPERKPASDDVHVRIDTIDPPVLTPGVELRVVATLINSSPTTISNAAVALRVTRFPMTVRSHVASWSNQDPTVPGYVGSIIESVPLPKALGPNETTQVTLRLPPNSIPAHEAYWGPHALAVEVNDDQDRRGLSRTFIPFIDPKDSSRLKVSVVLPIVPVSTTMRETTRIDRLSQIIKSAPVSVALDPTTLDAAHLGSEKLLATVMDAISQREQLPVPAGSLDSAAASHTGHPDLIATAYQQTAASWKDKSHLAPIAIPAFGIQDTKVLADLDAGSGAQAFIARAGELNPADKLEYTPSARTTINDVDVLVPDSQLGNIFTTSRSPVVAAQLALAETLVILREAPNKPRHVLIRLPFNWEPSVEQAKAQLEALQAAKWITLAPVSDLLKTAPENQRDALPADNVQGGEISATDVNQLLAARDHIQALAQVLSDPGNLQSRFDVGFQTVMSQSWRSEPSERTRHIGEILSLGPSFASQLRTIPGSDITQLSSAVELPIVVENTSAEKVNLLVRLVPSHQGPHPQKDVPITVLAHSQATARVPVTAHNNGPYTMKVQLLAPDGAFVANGASFNVNVQSEWETLVTIVLAGIFALVLTAGIVMAVRNRQGTRAEQMAAQGIPTTIESPDDDDE